jgi:hypothetical protein
MHFNKHSLAGLGLLLAALNAAADSAVLFDNLSAVSGGSDSPAGINFGPLADSFSTGADPISLTDIKLLLRGDSSGAGSLTVSVLGDGGGSPGAALATVGTLADSALSSTASVYDFQLSAPLDLSANTRYWLQVAATDDSGASWFYSSDTTGVGVAGEFYANAFNVYGNASNSPYQAQVSGVTAVPLPGAAWLFASALGGLGALRRRGLIQNDKTAMPKSTEAL